MNLVNTDPTFRRFQHIIIELDYIKAQHLIETDAALNNKLTFRELEFLTSFLLTEFLTLYHSWISCQQTFRL